MISIMLIIEAGIETSLSPIQSPVPNFPAHYLVLIPDSQPNTAEETHLGLKREATSFKSITYLFSMVTFPL
jgi:hypothetical protein